MVFFFILFLFVGLMRGEIAFDWLTKETSCPSTDSDWWLSVSGGSGVSGSKLQFLNSSLVLLNTEGDTALGLSSTSVGVCVDATAVDGGEDLFAVAWYTGSVADKERTRWRSLGVSVWSFARIPTTSLAKVIISPIITATAIEDSRLFLSESLPVSQGPLSSGTALISTWAEVSTPPISDSVALPSFGEFWVEPELESGFQATRPIPGSSLTDPNECPDPAAAFLTVGRSVVSLACWPAPEAMVWRVLAAQLVGGAEHHVYSTRETESVVQCSVWKSEPRDNGHALTIIPHGASCTEPPSVANRGRVRWLSEDGVNTAAPSPLATSPAPTFSPADPDGLTPIVLAVSSTLLLLLLGCGIVFVLYAARGSRDDADSLSSARAVFGPNIQGHGRPVGRATPSRPPIYWILLDNGLYACSKCRRLFKSAGDTNMHIAMFHKGPGVSRRRTTSRDQSSRQSHRVSERSSQRSEPSSMANRPGTPGVDGSPLARQNPLLTRQGSFKI